MSSKYELNSLVSALSRWSCGYCEKIESRQNAQEISFSEALLAKRILMDLNSQLTDIAATLAAKPTKKKAPRRKRQEA
jgi:hypothetical protein